MTSRSTDPETSREAGQLATTPAKLRASHALVLRVFEAYGSMNDKDLIERVHAVEKNLGLKKLMSPSGIRSRRSELAKPNMERLAAIFRDMTGIAIGPRDVHSILEDAATFGDPWPKWRDAALERIRAEGWPSKLIDTGKRDHVEGRNVIVWGLAK